MNPKTNQTHPLKDMRLAAFKISGIKCVREEYQQRLPTSSSIHGEILPKNKRTNKLRLNNTQLFLSFQKLYRPVKKGTIAKWIKQVLILAGIDMKIFTPHSTRGAATSYVSGRIPIATILRTAGWRKDSVFRKFYRRPITNDSSFSKEILMAEGK
ncbi:unnamed protein product [Mytilus coruscus]|uniref:Uncharacterized protein n=1 Tax=Mytilus coruscus TaxID=42192 RepID=A0A6J8C3V2_MYTCO|nr:unnamed protein product [Mytilus coruscus]